MEDIISGGTGGWELRRIGGGRWERKG